VTDTPAEPLGAVIHRRAVIACCVLAVLTVAAAAIIQWTGSGRYYSPQTEAVAVAELRFEDEADGVVAVYDAATGARLIEYGMDEGAFVRSVMRGIARQRRLRGEGRAVPVVLSEHVDGQLWLTDPTNGIEIYLGAFGPDNSTAFAELLEREEAIANVASLGEAS
jgi:putative photosynthetic complex assembly protein